MATIEAVKRVCERLERKGWGDLLRRHGLNIAKANLAAELRRKLHVQRDVPGFEDFCLTGKRGIEPGKPAASLLYHALASPNVHPTQSGQPAKSNDAYPTLADLDAVENYIYSLKPIKLGSRTELVLAVFAYQYRPAAATAHGYHADFVFSRTGVARVGTGPAVWDGPSRGFRAETVGRNNLAVTPARYAAFLAEGREPVAIDSIMGRRDQEEDEGRTFYFPVQKLFAGSGCVSGKSISLSFKEYHRNEKLKRVHSAGGIEIVNGFDMNAFPFVRDSRNGAKLVALRRHGDSVLVVPQDAPTLVRTITQKNAISKKAEVVRFVVPPATEDNRYSTSLELESGDDGARRAPEYVNIRHRVVRKSNGRFSVEDLKDLPQKQFDDLLKAGEYEAAHFVDDACDGAVAAVVHGLPDDIANLPAYSLVTAPDFFPLSDQLEVTNWVRHSFQNSQEHFQQGAPWPLCEGRLPPNIELPRPDDPKAKAFSRGDQTITAVVGTGFLTTKANAPGRRKRFASWLPDAASNVFAPGWDVSFTSDEEGSYLAAYGLGSPFPEDAKLCAALNSFWPAVAPDASRTFRMNISPTAMPLMDQELGYHPLHDKVQSGRVKSNRGWDGEYGPFFEKRNGKLYVNYASIARSDLVSNALRNELTVRLTAAIDSDQMIGRMEALRASIKALPPDSDVVSSTELWLVTAEPVADWEKHPARAKAGLAGSGFHYVFATTARDGRVTRDLTRLRVLVRDRFECQIAGRILYWRKNRGPWEAA